MSNMANHIKGTIFFIPRLTCFSGSHCSNVSSALRASPSDISRPSTGFYLTSLAFWFWTLNSFVSLKQNSFQL